MLFGFRHTALHLVSVMTRPHRSLCSAGIVRSCDLPQSSSLARERFPIRTHRFRDTTRMASYRARLMHRAQPLLPLVPARGGPSWLACEVEWLRYVGVRASCHVIAGRRGINRQLDRCDCDGSDMRPIPAPPTLAKISKLSKREMVPAFLVLAILARWTALAIKAVFDRARHSRHQIPLHIRTSDGPPIAFLRLFRSHQHLVGLSLCVLQPEKHVLFNPS